MDFSRKHAPQRQVSPHPMTTMEILVLPPEFVCYGDSYVGTSGYQAVCAFFKPFDKGLNCVYDNLLSADPHYFLNIASNLKVSYRIYKSDGEKFNVEYINSNENRFGHHYTIPLLHFGDSFALCLGDENENDSQIRRIGYGARVVTAHDPCHRSQPQNSLPYANGEQFACSNPDPRSLNPDPFSHVPRQTGYCTSPSEMTTPNPHFFGNCIPTAHVWKVATEISRQMSEDKFFEWHGEAQFGGYIYGGCLDIARPVSPDTLEKIRKLDLQISSDSLAQLYEEHEMVRIQLESYEEDIQKLRRAQELVSECQTLINSLSCSSDNLTQVSESSAESARKLAVEIESLLKTKVELENRLEQLDDIIDPDYSNAV